MPLLYKRNDCLVQFRPHFQLGAVIQYLYGMPREGGRFQLAQVYLLDEEILAG